ncbi:MAG: peptide ABC transporter substrate-binding protein, partial [Pyrinomonadaceae bacterium]
MVSRLSVYAVFFGVVLIFGACGELEKPKTEEFYSSTAAPNVQEFRWSNGGMPNTFDPAKASAPPETDIIRAIYDGLTDTDPVTLNAIPAIASEWYSDKEAKIWTFKLRKDAKWSNGKPVTAKDFVESWQRLSILGNEVPHHELLKNIVGVVEIPRHFDNTPDPAEKVSQTDNVSVKTAPSQTPVEKGAQNLATPMPSPLHTPMPEIKKFAREKFGVEANGEFELVVRLHQPDKEFPRLAAHTIFRPLFRHGEEFASSATPQNLVTNGAFSVVSTDRNGVLLNASNTYWDKENVKIKRVRFVPNESADKALSAYKNGEIDAVTNANFQPLALKLLTPYDDFHRFPHGALNLYEINMKRAPFNDVRVREALAIAIQRDRLTQDEMSGATTPAQRFLPFPIVNPETPLAYNPEKARELLKQAGFEEGVNFPVINLVINRNNVQEKIAKSVAEMWKTELNVKTNVNIVEYDDIEHIRETGTYDLIRRNIVLPTADETANMIAIFEPTSISHEIMHTKYETNEVKNSNMMPNGVKTTDEKAKLAGNSNAAQTNNAPTGETNDPFLVNTGDMVLILTEQDALTKVPGIPLYFPTSYSLVKPYVRGFQMNSLDSP